MRVLISWLGQDDVVAAEGGVPKYSPTLWPSLGGAELPVDRVVLLNNLGPERGALFVSAISSKWAAELYPAPLNSPVDYSEIHGRAVEAIEFVRKKYGAATELVFFLNSGTPPMGSMWLLLGKGRYRATFMAWGSREQSAIEVEVPFEINADFVPSLLEGSDALLRERSAAKAPATAAFSKMVYRCRRMQELVERAQRVALHNVPVLIEGETGTGKELLAAALHDASPRKRRPFVPVNCGAIPPELVESELFGTVRGGFTGAEDRPGKFDAADGGTLFLDEIGELPLAAQVKLLRPLQEGEVVPVGSTSAHKVDVRVVAATHRELVTAVEDGGFREDLFYRLAVATLKLPALHEREGDLQLLVDRLLADINEENAKAGMDARHLSAEARNRLSRHPWPGNIRELANTLRRAVVWSKNATLTARDVEEALLKRRVKREADVMNRPIGGAFRLDDLLDEVQAAYIERALALSNRNKTVAASLLGLNSRQVLTGRIESIATTRIATKTR